MGRTVDLQLQTRILNWLGRHWKLITLATWLAVSAWFILQGWDAIRSFELGDTDDNMRMMQVRDLLRGQDWFDLRQYRLNPPVGSNIHWSRLVDLPIAGLILVLRPFLGGAAAERWAVAIAPLLPYLLLLFSIALTVRRLVDPRAYAIAFIALFFAVLTNGMFLPERIDHHGWQLALLAFSTAGIADPQRWRGGIVLGISTALSLAIGLEMLIYLAISGIAMTLFWVADRDERQRLTGYAVALAGGTALAYSVFASYANRGAVCDALSIVWLTDALLGGALLIGLARLSPVDWKTRLALGVGAGLVVAGVHASMFPHCLRRLEGISPEVERLWLSHVREARPVYDHGWAMATLTLALPIVGTIGWLLLMWSKRTDAEFLRRIMAAVAPGVAATLLLFWQIRTGAAAQMLALSGTAGFIWLLIPRTWNSRWMIVRVLGTCVVTIIGVGAAVPLTLYYLPVAKEKTITESPGPSRSCNSLQDFYPVDLQPKGIVFTFVDLAPRLITVTHHDSVTGPYHRNGQQIADVMNAFRGSEAQAHVLIAKYHSTYLLTCPSGSTTSMFMSEAPKGFYAQLQRGHVPKWLSRVDLPNDSPFQMWRVTG
ncbi:MAG: AcrB/AcrD/AcrF family protein [Gemmataceae bacterium]